MKTNSLCFSEVVQSSLEQWKAQTWKWDNFPQFGSIVTIESGKRTIFGVVFQVQTGSLDPIHAPVAYQKTEEELKSEQPQIFEFLKTTFDCLTIGYKENGKFFYTLAPEPPKIHAFVSKTTSDMAKSFLHSNQYLHLLFGHENKLGNIDELLLAILKFKASKTTLTQESIEKFSQTFSLITGNDYRRLKLFLLRAQNIFINN
ncbi:hypothetical protein HN446_05310 [bacterium]|jgi:hypothetical protein|nr:hypothetical protein [bacterium]